VNEKWDGSERRQPIRDHDTLIQMVQILQNHVHNFDDHRKEFKNHEIKDETNYQKLEKVNQGTQKIIWTATGLLLSVQVIPACVKVLHIFNK
jgi:hypothetical protein